MPNGWGGARPGAGRKKPGANPGVAGNGAKAAAEPKRRTPAIPPELLQQILSRGRRRRSDSPELNPFTIRDLHPPRALPGNSKLRLAMDDSTSWSATQWAGGVLGGMAAEGLLFLGYPFLSELAQRPEYRTFSETIATEMTRKWIELKSVSTEKKKAERAAERMRRGGPETDPDDDAKAERSRSDEEKADKIRQLTDDMDRLEVRDRFADLALHDGFFGRSHLFMDFGVDLDGDTSELATPIGDGRNETSKGKVRKGSLKRLQVIEPVWTYPTTYNADNPLKEDWYNPQVWYVMGKEIHRSRMPTFIGRPVPDMLKPAYSFGGLSLSQLAKPYVDIWLETRESIGRLIHSFSVMVLLTDLNTILQPGQAAQLLNRVGLFNALRDNQDLMVLNKDSEDFKNVTAPLSGLHELQAQSQEHMMSVARIPSIKFTGIQPSGLNASSEGEMRAFNDTINAYQGKFYRPNLTRLIHFEQLSLWGEVDPDITFDFVPLVELTEKERAELRKLEAETDDILVNGCNAISNEEVRARVAADPDSPYSSLDVDDVPEPPDPGEGENINLRGTEPYGGKGGEGEGGEAGDEAVIPFVEDAWAEADHPRGQPGNPGQFGPGGGGSSKKTQVPHAPQFGLQQGKFTAAALGGFSPPAGSRGNVGAPVDPAKMKKVGAQMGSNPGGVYEDERGRRFYVKQGKSKDHVRNEMTAAALYDLAGTPTLRYRPVEGGAAIATEMEKLDKDNASKLSPEQRREAKRDFAVHAWLGNWDAVGLGGDNLGTVGKTPLPLDLGGALEYRAMGAPKGKAFGTSVGELDTLRDPKVNKDTAGVFGDITPAELRESARYVVGIKDDRIRAVVEKNGGSAALADKLIARKNDIAARARTFGAEGDPASPGGTMVIPAGEKAPLRELNGVKFEAWRPPSDWAGVDGQADLDEPPLDAKGKQAASGVVIREKDGRVWLVQPRGGYNGYEGTFPKGGLEKGLSLQANAIKEAWEESGLKVRITGHLDDHAGDVTMTRYYTAEREGGDPSVHDDESEGVVLAPKDKLSGFLSRARDDDVARSIGGDELAADALFDDPDLDTEFWISSTRRPQLERVEVNVNTGPSASRLLPQIERALAGGEGEEDSGGEAEAADEFKEAEHPRDPEGKFATSGSGGGGGVSANPEAIASLLSKPAIAGGNYRRALIKMIKALPNGAEKTGLQAKLVESWKKTHANYLKKGDAVEANKIAAKLKKLGVADIPPAIAPIAPPKASKESSEAFIFGGLTYELFAAQMKDPTTTPEMVTLLKKHNPALNAIYEAKTKSPPPTPQELEKAKKTVPLQLQYIPGAPTEPPHVAAQAQKLVDEFNAKWAGKALTQEQLVQKVTDFKVMQAKMKPIAAQQGEAAAKAKAEFEAKQKAQAAAAANAKAQAEQKAKAAADLKKLMSDLGVTDEKDAEAFQGLMEMTASSNPAQALAHFQSLESQAKDMGLALNGFEYAMLRSYTGSAYAAVNSALREGSWSANQHVYVNTVNKALKKMPPHTGATKRGATLSTNLQALYKEGNVVEERAFTSTSKHKGWGGNTNYVISGKSGRDVSKLSLHPGEAEVLYPARTFFRVHKVEGKPGGQMTVHMEEVEAW